MKSHVVTAAAIIAAILHTNDAYAQSSPPSAPANPSPDNATDVDDIIVTAQRRSERLIDVPIAITTIDAAMLEQAGLTQLIDITRLAPGVVMSKNGAYLQPTIRGIGTSPSGPGADPNVALYVDGVYQSSQTGNQFELANLAGVEILKGPQGTLFGRNATGGAILVKLLEPSFTPTGKVNLSFGRYNELLASAYYSTALSSTIAMDVSAYARRSDGFIRDLRTGADHNRQQSYDIRSKLLIQASDAVSLTFALSHNNTSDPTGLAVATRNQNTVGNSVAGSGPIADERGELSHDLPPRVDVEATNVSLHAGLETEFGKLTSITAYRRENARIDADLEGSYAVLLNASYTQPYRTFSQEFSLASVPGAKLSYVAGVYYFRERAGQPFFRINGNPIYSFTINTDAISGYADATLDLGSLAVIGGFRYSSETKAYDFVRGAATTLGRINKETFSNFTPRAGLRYSLDPRSNVYATFSKGFKSGTFNGSSGSPVPVEPEKVDAYEIGYKRQDGAFGLNLSAYYYSYKDIQIVSFDFNVGIARLINAARSEIYGADAELTAQISDRLKVRAGIAYTHAEYDSFPGAITFVPRPNNAGNTTVIIDAAGNPMVRAPRVTVSGSVNYRQPIGNNMLEVSLLPYYSSRVTYTFDRRISQPEYFTLDASAVFELSDGLRIGVYGRNLTNKVYASFRTATSNRDGIVYAQPRTYGVAANYRF